MTENGIYAVSAYAYPLSRPIEERIVREDRLPDFVIDLVKRGADIILIRKLTYEKPKEVETLVEMESSVVV